MSKLGKLLFSSAIAFFLLPAHGALHDRGGGFIYDDVLDITWVQNTGITPDSDWDTQMAWVDSLILFDAVRNVYWDDWRLPNADSDGDNFVSTCFASDPEPCSDNEIGYLFYVEDPLTGGIFTGWNSSFVYWSSTEISVFGNPSCIDCAYAMNAFPGYGVGVYPKAGSWHAWAVRDGDVANAPQVVGVDVVTPGIHPHHDGSPSSPSGINDQLAVNVFGSSIANGDAVDFFVTDIDHSTVEFGPSGGGYDPSSTPVTNADINGDGDNDAQYEFLMGDTGIACGETEATLVGETTLDTQFGGADSIITACNASCH